MNLLKANVVVTGASRGLGKEIALKLAEKGANLALVARQIEPLEELATLIKERGGKAIALSADLADPQVISGLVGTTHALLGPIDIVIHNASTLGAVPLRLLLDTDDDTWYRTFQVNVHAPFLLTKAFAGAMAMRKKGLVVHISSDAAVEGYAKWGAYGASKAALDQLSRIWAEELKQEGVQVFSVDPGEMNTQMHADAIPDADVSLLQDPAEVAHDLVAMLENHQRLAPGARIAIQSGREQ
jgi:NAD(P)-dependent dehydrogenase (short-subunit alcohol dehydrogenase family)